MHKIIDSLVTSQLFNDARLTPTDALVWVQLHRNPVNTVAGHGRVLNFRRETLRRSVSRLVELGWAYKTKRPGYHGDVVVPAMPVDVEQLVINELLRVRDEVAFVGEWLMKCVLDLVVDDHDFRDNARLRWLVPGDGSPRLELDRWYRSAKVAVEFNGSQHYRPDTPLHANPEEFRQQQFRDNLKAGLCTRHGIAYVEIAAWELDFEPIMKKLEGLLPLRPIRPERPLVKALSNMCRSYVNTVSREERRRGERIH